MTNPNLRYTNNIYGNTTLHSVTTSTSNVLANASASNKIYKINSIFCANITTNTPADISVAIYNGSSDIYIARNITVPGASTLVVGSKETYFYLMEGWTLRALASAASTLSLVVSYEEID